MKPAPFRYARPDTLEKAVALLASFGRDARLLAGGQSLVPRLNLRLERPAVIVDLALVSELEVLRRDDGELVIGAGIRQHAAETSPVVRAACPLLPLALDHAGPLPVRVRGTVGGSLAYADPAAELPAVALTLDARLVAVGPRGARTIPADEFFHGPHSTALAGDEILTEVRVPIRPAMRYAFLEVSPRARTAAIAGVAAAVHVGDDGRVAEARLTAIGVGAGPTRLTSAEDAARGTVLDPLDRQRVAAAVADGSFHRHVLATLVTRALERVAA